ncbi:DUF3021 family protein [Actinomyces sp. zg-332]|nr:DUF3021 family protein [Actinomyces sp. zg-332]QPK94706.1 DUF3021 family protein [Actinomyces sp. zg-332]
MSFINGNQAFTPTHQSMIVAWNNNENIATLIQGCLGGVIGFVLYASSIVWDYCDCSINKQILLVYLLNMPSTFIATYVCYWVDRNWYGYSIFLGIYTSIFTLIGIVYYYLNVENVKRINAKL